jgi:hypothetical protein
LPTLNLATAARTTSITTTQGQSHKMPSEKRWGPAQERDLAIAIILSQAGDRPKYNWEKVTEIMTNWGHQFTRDAIKQVHFLFFFPQRITLWRLRIALPAVPVTSSPLVCVGYC